MFHRIKSLLCRMQRRWHLYCPEGCCSSLHQLAEFTVIINSVKYSVPLNERNKMSGWVSGGVLVFTPSVDMVYTLAWEPITFTVLFDGMKGDMDPTIFSLTVNSPLLTREQCQSLRRIVRS
ncbi:Tyrosine-Protein Kinase Yes [Manis pentadactyla]|nr:Tyrosine-Protein Kinase Yes [Manis pentadactyla]